MRRADLGAYHEEGAVRLLADIAGLERLREAGPPGAGIELVEGAEERLARDDVHVDPGLVVVPVLVVERPLGRVALRHLVLQRRERAPQVAVARLLEVHGMPSSRPRGGGGRLRVCGAGGQQDQRQPPPHNTALRETHVTTSGNVERMGFEPTTPWLQTRCSPS